MQIIKLSEVAGQRFPSGRWTRPLVGVTSPLQAEHFVTGYVVVHPGGSIPAHEHDEEEVYIILKGQGEVKVAQDVCKIDGVAAVYIPPGHKHRLVNTGNTELEMMFIYAPAGVVAHWQQELKGKTL